MKQTIFITGTDTGVGKTLLTAMLIQHLRDSGVRAVGLKPFCSGTRNDAKLLYSLAKNDVSIEEVNPFYFDKPLAPRAAMLGSRQDISCADAIAKIRPLQKRFEITLIEGSGGVLVPLGKHFMVIDLIAKLKPRTVVVARNRLGTINHTLLTVRHLQDAGIEEIMIVLVGAERPDISAQTNKRLLEEALGQEIFLVPFLGKKAEKTGVLKKSVKFLKKTLARIVNLE